MRKSFSIASVILIGFFMCLNGISRNWKSAGEKIKTQWADKVDPSNTLPEYPRLALVRDQ